MKLLLNKLHTIFIKIINYSIGFLLSGMVVIVFLNVIFRYFLNSSIAWTEEVSRMMLIWLVFLGAIMAYIHNEHLGLDILIKAFPKKIAQLLIILADILIMYALAIVLIGGIEMTNDSFASGWVSSAVPILYGYVYLIVPISALVILIESLLKLITDIINCLKLLKGE